MNATKLFPDITDEIYADAAAHAERISTETMPCDAEDVLLGAIISRLGADMLEQGPDLRTKAMRRLFDPSNVATQRCVIMLAQMLRKTAEPTPEAIEAAALRLVTTLSAVLVVVAPDTAKIRKHGRG